jgi:Ca2+-binding RTX toxin-like protein
MAETTITIFGNGAGTYTGEFIQGTAAANVLPGTDGNDIIVGGAGGDTINGGKGDDVLIGASLQLQAGGPNAGEYSITNAGGGPADTFVFNFNISQSEGATLYFRDGNTPNYTANQQAWDNFQEQLAAWRAEMLALHGTDSDTGTQSTDIYTSAKKSQPSTYVGTEVYDNSYTVAGETVITSTDGNDQILDFQWGTDQLNLGAVTKQQFIQYFTVTNNADGSTTISLDAGGWSVKILGAFGHSEAEWADHIFG